ncbi:hypothetical protein Tco_0282474 [Tanacetum coccineum]
MSNLSSVSRCFQPNFIPEFIQSTQHAQSNQGEPKVQKDYKAEYKKMKAKLALLEASPPTYQPENPFNQRTKAYLLKRSIGMRKKYLTMRRRQGFKLNLDSKLPNFNTGRILVPESEVVNECIKLTEVSSDPEFSKELGSEPQAPLPPMKNLQGASPSSEAMTLTYQDHSPKERSGLGTMKHTKPETQESSSKNVSGPVIVSNPEPVISSVPTEVKTNDQESKINELTKLPESSKSVNSSKQSHDSKSNGKNPDSYKPIRPKPLQKPKLKCELCNYTNHSTDDCYRILYCMKCKREDHRTSDHDMYIASLRSSQNYKAQPYQYASPSKQILKSKAKPYPPCTYYGFNDHRPDDCRNYPECEICGSYDYFTSEHNRVIQIRGGVLAESSQSSESSIGVSCTTCGSSVHSTTDHNDFEHFKRGEKLQATKAKEPIKKWVHKRN